MHRVLGLGWPVPRGGVVPLATAGLLSLSLPSLAADTSLRARIEQRLASTGLDRDEVEVDVDHGRVVLSGSVASRADRHRAERAARVESRRVINRLRVA